MNSNELLPLARMDLATFAALLRPDFELAPHVEMLASVLEQIERGELKRVMVAMPPRHRKSLLCSEALPA